jgi:hypothetical protein
VGHPKHGVSSPGLYCVVVGDSKCPIKIIAFFVYEVKSKADSKVCILRFRSRIHLTKFKVTLQNAHKKKTGGQLEEIELHVLKVYIGQECR